MLFSSPVPSLLLPLLWHRFSMDCSPFGELLWGQLELLVWHRADPHLFPQVYPMLCLPPTPASDCQNLATGTQYSLEAILVAEQNT